MNKPNNEKYIVITGACGGIGGNLADKLLSDGYNVWAVDLNEEALREKYEGRAKYVACDLNDEDAISSMIKSIVSSTGQIDGLVHCAGFDKLSPLFLNKRKDVEALMNIHVYAAMDMCKMLAKKGNAAPGCSVVLISSLSAHEGAKGHSAYAAAKGAIEGFLAPASSELAAKGIRLNVVVLGAVNTSMTMGYVGKMDETQRAEFEASYPLGFGCPDNVTGLIAFLLSDKASWMTGQKYIIDGGHLIR